MQLIVFMQVKNCPCK